MDVYLRGPEGKTKALTFSYDDGVEQDIRFVGILDKYNMKATFNINSGLFALEGTVYPEGQVHRRMTKAMCEKIYVNHEVAVHTLTHPWLENMSDDANHSKCYNPTTTKVWFATDEKTYCIAPDETVIL